MKTKPKRLWYIIGFLSTLLLGLAAYGTKYATPPDRSQLVGSWFGFDENRLYFCRLELGADGKGVFSKVYVNDPARLYSVEKWSLTEFALALELKPVDKELEEIYLKGFADSTELSLEMGGVSNKWKRQITLFNEQEFLTKNKKNVERIAKFKAESGR